MKEREKVINNMNLQETIRKVLKEEEKKKNLSVPLKKLIEYFLRSSEEKEYICDYKLELGKFATKNSGERYQRFKVTLYFDSGHGSKNWPKTMAVHNKEEKIMNELQDLIIDTFGIIVDIYGSSRPNCKNIDESIIKEESEIPLFVRRRNRYTDEEIINYLRKFAIQSFKLEKVVAVVVWWACKNTAYEILDSTHTHLDNDEFHDAEKKNCKLFKGKVW